MDRTASVATSASSIGPQVLPHKDNYGVAGSESDSEPIGWLVGEYLAGYTGNTYAAYRRDLTDFLTYCRDVGVHPVTVDRAQVAGYLQDMQDRGLAPATVARRLVALRGLYRLAVETGIRDRSPVYRLPVRARLQNHRIPALTAAQLRGLLAAADTAGRRTAGLAWLLASTGLRVSEACNARIQDLHIQPEEVWLDVVCKGSVRRSVPVHPYTWSRLEPLCRPQWGPMFQTATGRALDRRAAARTLSRVAATAGVPGRFSPHLLRHTFVTLARQSGCPLEDVQDAVGHADPATTRRYDRTVLGYAGHPAHRLLAGLSPTGSEVAT